MARACIHCGTDISERHYHATCCFGCMGKWGILTGARRAYGKVQTAIKQGLLLHPSKCSCVDCGRPARDYDHRDYNKPLEVVPVCRPCNKLRGPAIPISAT